MYCRFRRILALFTYFSSLQRILALAKLFKREREREKKRERTKSEEKDKEEDRDRRERQK